ncbi:FUSC family protein [Pseudomonas sp. AP3_22 TE3818]
MFTPPPGTTWSGAGFAVRTTAASLIALYIAFLIGLDAPKWAAMTVWIVAQESRGMSLSKSKYRMAGTTLGAVVAVALIALFSQTPALIMLTLALWLGLCTGIATALRNFRAYGAVLAGYTAVIIVMDAVAAPEHVFDIAIARITYIFLGIIVEAVLAAIFAPGNPLNDARRQLDGYVRQAAAICAATLKGDANDVALHPLMAKAVNLHTALEYAAAGSTVMKCRLGHFQACATATLALLVAARQSKTPPAGALELMSETQALLEAVATNPSARHLAVASLNERVKTACSQEALTVGALPSPRLILLDQLRVLLESLHQALVQLDSLDHEQAPALPLAFHIDPVAAVHNGVRTFLAVLAAASFCMVTGWSSGPGFVTIVGVVCALFATRANPVAGGIGFMLGAACAAIAAALCNFVLLPAVSDFAMLALITGGFMCAAGLAMRHPRTAAPGASFAIFFWNLISPQNNSQMIDAANFFNGVLILLLGMACGTLIFALVFPASPRAARYRLHRAVRRDLRRIGHHPGRWTGGEWLTRTADRLGHQLTAVGRHFDTQAGRELRGLLGAWTIGDAVIALHQLAEGFHPARRPVAVLLRRLTDIDPLRLARAARSSARHFTWQSRGASESKRQDLLSAAILSLAIAEAASEHGAFLGAG